MVRACEYCERTVATLQTGDVFAGCCAAHVTPLCEPCPEGAFEAGDVPRYIEITSERDRERNLEALLAEVGSW